jgi:hypothetical protein
VTDSLGSCRTRATVPLTMDDTRSRYRKRPRRSGGSLVGPQF